MQRGRTAVTLALALALGLVAAACGEEPTIRGGQGQPGGEDTPAGDAFDITQAEDHGAADLSGQSETSLELDDFYFQPTVLIGEPGQTLSIELENEGTAPHTFTIESADIDEELQPGDKVETDVTFPDSGALTFICRFHAGGGMQGALSVSGDLGATGTESKGEGGGSGSGSGGGGDSSEDDY
jgi:plastocyanin